MELVGPKENMVVIMGATGTGKSRLSVELATRFPAEIINSDKMQIFRGLDITTNKIPISDRNGVPHHLLGDLDSDADLDRSDFRRLAADQSSAVASRGKLPLLVGGSNSFVYSFLAENHDPDFDPFSDSPVRDSHRRVRYECRFLWVHVAPSVLREHLDRRVDEMLRAGMLAELAEFDGTRSEPASRTGIRRAIGVPEFERFFARFGTGFDDVEGILRGGDRVVRRAYEEAVFEIKENTWQLARRQVGKIVRLRNLLRWDLRKLDATEAVKAAMMTSESSEAWDRNVLDPSVKIVRRFLDARLD